MIPLSGLLIAGLTVAAVFGGAWLAVTAAGLTANLRDHLRARYLQDHVTWRAIDALVLPGWLLTEFFCLVLGALGAVLQVGVAVMVARQARDWWHRGPRR